MGPVAYLVIIRGMYDTSWKSKAATLPMLLIYTAGISVNNTVAVFDAVFGRKNEFLRTPKYGVLKNRNDWKQNAYNLPFSEVTLLEIFFGLYGVTGIFISIFTQNAVFAPIIALQTVGFFYIAYMSISHTRFRRNKSGPRGARTKSEIMAEITHKVAVTGIIAIIVFGAFMSYHGYSTNIYPLDRVKGNLDGVVASSDPDTIRGHLVAVKEDLSVVLDNALIPERTDANGALISKNPVWVFSTETTNFIRIDANVDTMLAIVDRVATSPQTSSAYHTGMMSLNSNSEALKDQVGEAIPFMYASISNIAFAALWMGSIMGVFVILKRKKRDLEASKPLESGV